MSLTKAPSITPLLSYYRNSLADADRMAPEDSLIQNGILTDDDAWLTGQLHREQADQLWAARNPNGKVEMDDMGRKRYWYCPWVGTLKPEHGAARHGLPTRLVPLWIPVRITSNGSIEPDPILLPWIPRNLLEPIYPARLVLGHIHDADTYIAANPWQEPEADDDETPAHFKERKMRAWLDYGYKLVEYVTKQPWSTFQLEEYHIEPQGRAIPAGAPSAKISGLLAHYDALIRDKIVTPPLQRFINGETFPTDNDSKASRDDPRALHIAHLPGLPSLSADQRSALHLASVHHPDVLAVHGPPGTGKTKWIAELALQAYVESALNEDPNPPLQIWIAGTNQAIFSSLATLRGNVSSLRWAYPNINGLGIWCAARWHADKQTNPSNPVAAKGVSQSNEQAWLGFKWNDGMPEGSPSEWGSEDAVLEAIANFQAQAQHHFGEFLELSDIKPRIWNELQKSVNPLRTTWRLLQRDKQRKTKMDDLLTSVEWPTSFEEYAKTTQGLFAKRKKALERIHYIAKEWATHKTNTPLWVTLTASLPGFANRFMARNKQFFERFKLQLRGVDMSSHESIDAALKRLTKDIENLAVQTQEKFKVIRVLKKEKDDIAMQWATLSEQWHASPRWYDDGSVDAEWELACDTHYRTDATMWAIRYWEAVYLERRRAYYSDARAGRLRSKYDGWRELACLTPMLAMTLHTAPRYFQEGYDERDVRPMYGLAHRMVIEESSQLSPDVVTGLLAYARSAVFVGDEKQLLPIWAVPEKTDIGNLLQHQLMDNLGDLPRWKDSELMASCGSALLRAKQSGLNVFLKEQHRSHPELVAFANRLCYDNRIVPMRADPDPDFPAFAYGHVVGALDNQLGSKGNRIEAQAIAQYLLKVAPYLKQRYGVDKLGDCIAIVTPFVRQVHWLKQECQKRLHPDDVPNIGTVHAYQGSEKPMMIFSAVQSVTGQDIPFFDMDSTMLNVAVSRARDAFWYVGNMNGMTGKGLRPSSILAQFLVKGKYQRLAQWSLPFDTPHDLKMSTVMSSDPQQRVALLTSFITDTPAGTLHIASPYFDENYLDEINFWPMVGQATQRGVGIFLHANKRIQTFHGEASSGDLLRLASSHGIQWQWHDGLFDSRIWTTHRMAECSSSWGAPLDGGSFLAYEGAVQLWCQAQIGSWGAPTKGLTFGSGKTNTE